MAQLLSEGMQLSREPNRGKYATNMFHVCSITLINI